MTIKHIVLDNFEHGDISKYRISHNYVKSYSISLSDEQALDGKYSLKLEYNLGGWLHGNGPMPIIFKDRLITNKRPLKFGLWVHGDQKSPWLRAVFLDGQGERKTVNLTPSNINWLGWKYLDVDIDQTWKLPLKLEQIYSVETNKELQGDHNYHGEIFFDQLRFVYIDDEDLKGPEFKNTIPKNDTVYERDFTFRTKVVDEQSGVNPDSIIMKVNDKKVDHKYCERTKEVIYEFEQVEHGTYRVQVEAMDYAGNKAVPNIDRLLFIDLTPDTDQPIISNITPTEKAIEYTNTPRVTFNLIDEKSGVRLEDIIVKIDGIKQNVKYDEETGWAYAVSKYRLLDGVHELVIEAKDRAGNKIDPVQRKFTVQTINDPKTECFSVSIIPDTHRFDYGRIGFMRAIEQKTDFIIHMGDLVDQATEEEYEQVRENLNILQDKVLLTTPGNHESFQGNLDKYMETFGSPTFHMEYGHTLFIFLNSAYEQSLHHSDSTQFIYLEETLSLNKHKNVVIITHVTTKDDYGTSHEMERSEAKELEQILSSYKRVNEEVNITVLFGHLHILKQWEVSGVQYIITGNCAAKGYVAHEYGNLFGNGILHISPNGINYEFIPYVQELYIYLNDRPVNKIVMEKGTQEKIEVYGYINEIHTNYTINLSNFNHVRKEWSSTNEKIASISNNGILHALSEGESTINVHVGGKLVEIKVKVINSK